MRIIVIGFLFLTILSLFFNCKGTSTNPGSSDVHITVTPNGGLQPTNADSTPSTPPTGYEQPTGCVNVEGGAWGGITCSSNSNRDQSFREFLSSGTLITGGRDNLGTLGEISCQPGNSGGVLFKITAPVDGKFNPAGENPNLIVQSSGTQLHFHVIHKPVNEGQQSAFDGPITAQIQAVSGNVNGKRATLTFEDEKGSVTFDGNFDVNWYQGTVQYNNNVKKCSSSDSNCNESDGSRGTLGQFRIPTCKVFFSLK